MFLNRFFSFFLFFLISCGMHVFLFAGLNSLYFVFEVGKKAHVSTGSRLVIEYQFFERMPNDFYNSRNDSLKVKKIPQIAQHKKIDLNTEKLAFQVSKNVEARLDDLLYSKNNHIVKKKRIIGPILQILQ